MRRTLFCLLILTALFSNIFAQNQQLAAKDESTKNNNPDAAQIITSDIDLFWRAYDMAKPENNLNVFRDEYLKKGSEGLQAFRSLRIGNVCNLVDVIDTHPKYYAALRESTKRVDSFKPQIIASFRKLKEIYPDAVFPNVYMLIGRMNSGGTLTGKGLLIGVEMYGKTKDTQTDEFSSWQKAVVGSIEDLPYIVAHESIHYQQKYLGNGLTLLGKSIREGSADFIAELITGRHINPHLHVYGNPIEKELWMEFQKEMNGEDVSNWMYQGDKAKDRPADLGYYMGYKICEAYYKRAADKKQAVRDILEIKDFQQFFKASGYEEKFSVK